MSDAAKRWIGISAAVFAALALAATELVDREEDWSSSGIVAFEEADSATYETATQSVAVELPEVSAADPTATSVGTRSVAPVGAIGTAPPQVLPTSRLSVSRDGHFSTAPAAAAEFFDSYYRTYSSSSDEVVRGRIVLALLDALPPRAADEAISALDEWRSARAASGD